MNALMTRFVANRHTSTAAVIYAFAAFGIPLIATWWPDHQAQLDSSRKTLEALAVFYGFAAAGDAGANVAGQTPIKTDSPAVPQPQPPKP